MILYGNGNLKLKIKILKFREQKKWIRLYIRMTGYVRMGWGWRTTKEVKRELRVGVVLMVIERWWWIGDAVSDLS